MWYFLVFLMLDVAFFDYFFCRFVERAHLVLAVYVKVLLLACH